MVASCPPMPRPRARAPNKQGGKPAGQDTSSYTGYTGGPEVQNKDFGTVFQTDLTRV